MTKMVNRSKSSANQERKVQNNKSATNHLYFFRSIFPMYMEIVFNFAMIIWFASFRCHYVTWNISDATICDMKYFRCHYITWNISAISSFIVCVKYPFLHPHHSSFAQNLCTLVHQAKHHSCMFSIEYRCETFEPHVSSINSLHPNASLVVFIEVKTKKR